MRTDNTTTEGELLYPLFKEVLTFRFGQLVLPVKVSRLPQSLRGFKPLLQAETPVEVIGTPETFDAT